MKKLFFISLVTFVLSSINSCSFIDNKESKVQDYLQDKVVSESQGAIKLENLKKINGYKQDVLGMKMYVIEWSANILVQKEIWKVGNNIEGYWQSFSVTVEEPDFLNAYANVNAPMHLGTGALINITGEAQLHKTEQGWRVEELNVNKYQILNEGDLPENKFIGKWKGGSMYEGEQTTFDVICEIKKDDKGFKFIFEQKGIFEKDNNYIRYKGGKFSGNFSFYEHGRDTPVSFTIELKGDALFFSDVWGEWIMADGTIAPAGNTEEQYRFQRIQ